MIPLVSFSYAPELTPEILDGFARLHISRLVMSHKWCRQALAHGSGLFRDALTRGFTFPDAHCPYGEEWDLNGSSGGVNAQTVLPPLGELGAARCVIHVGPNYAKDSIAANLDRCRASLDRLLPVAAQYGVRILTENIYYPSVSTTDSLLTLLKEYPDLGLCYDAGHAHLMERARNGVMPRHCPPELVVPAGDTLARLGFAVRTCHLHDNDGSGDAHLPPGGGTVDWTAEIAALRSLPHLESFQSEVHATDYGLSQKNMRIIFKRIGLE